MVFTWACQSAGQKSTYKLSDDQLTHLLLDIQFSEVTLAELTKPKKDSLIDLYWLRFAEIYKISSEEIKTEMMQLEADPVKMKLIVDRMKMLADSLR
jgi:hypothetical protein